MFLFSAIIGIIAGLYVLFALSDIWFLGLLLIFTGLIYLGRALMNREYVKEEHEKPLIDAVPQNEDDRRFNKTKK